MRLLEAAMARPGLTLERAIALVDYHVAAQQGRPGSPTPRPGGPGTRGVKFLRL